MQRIVDNLRSSPEDDRRGVIKLDEDRTEGDVIEIRIGRKRDDRGRIDLEAKPTITLGLPVVKEANGATHPLNPMESRDRKSTRLNSSHLVISYAVFCLKKKK